MKIKYLTFECISRCNMDCNFCFSDWRNKIKEMKTEEIKEILKGMKKKGLEAVSFTGGEPLLRKDMAKILRFSKNIGLTTILTTNGILLKKKIKEIAPHVDFIGLPLDSSNEEMHNKMRITKEKINHYKLVLELIDFLHENYPNIKIKINTVVSKKNKDSIAEIGEMIKGKIVSWKLSCFVPGSYGEKFKKEFEISDLDYNNIVDESKKKNKNLNIIHSEKYTRDSACRVVSCDGHLIKPCKNCFIDLGEILSVNDKKMKEDFDFERSEYFLNKTYPSNER